MFAVLHSDNNSLKSGLLHLTGQPYCKKSRSAKVKDGIINLILKTILLIDTKPFQPGLIVAGKVRSVPKSQHLKVPPLVQVKALLPNIRLGWDVCLEQIVSSAIALFAVSTLQPISFFLLDMLQNKLEYFDPRMFLFSLVFKSKARNI